MAWERRGRPHRSFLLCGSRGREGSTACHPTPHESPGWWHHTFPRTRMTHMTPFSDLGRVNFVLNGDLREGLVQKLGSATCSLTLPSSATGLLGGAVA